jgi:hypothetical protein
MWFNAIFVLFGLELINHELKVCAGGSLFKGNSPLPTFNIMLLIVFVLVVQVV